MLSSEYVPTLIANNRCSIHNALHVSRYLVHFSYALLTLTYPSDMDITPAKIETITELQLTSDASEMIEISEDADRRIIQHV